jgi:hypothetical protein
MIEDFKIESKRFINSYLYGQYNGIEKVLTKKISLEALIWIIRQNAGIAYANNQSTFKSVIGKTIDIKKNFTKYLLLTE